MYQFENYLSCKIKNAFVKSTLLLILFFSYSHTKAQSNTAIDSAEILRKVALQDSIFNHLNNVQPAQSAKAKKSNVEQSVKKAVQDSSFIDKIHQKYLL